MPERRHGVSGARRQVVAVERRRQEHKRPRVDDVLARLAFSDPCVKRIAVQLHHCRKSLLARISAALPQVAFGGGRMLRRSAKSHSAANITTATNGSATAFMRSQPAISISAPAENDERPITANTMKSFSP